MRIVIPGYRMASVVQEGSGLGPKDGTREPGVSRSTSHGIREWQGLPAPGSH